MDISMCVDDSCPARHDCRRHADSGTVPSDNQCYSDFMADATGACDGYWHVLRAENKCAKCGQPVSDTDTIIYNKKTGVLRHAECNKVI
jgi:hypothetical protein